MVTPMSESHWDRVPELDCGRTGMIASVLVPPTSFHFTAPVYEELISEALQEKIAVRSVSVRLLTPLPPLLVA